MSLNVLSCHSPCRFQDVLSEAQGIPVVGPLCVSPAKAIASVAEIIEGIALFTLIRLFVLCQTSPIQASKDLSKQEIKDFSKQALISCSVEGLSQLGSSIINMCTLGLLSQNISNFFNRTANKILTKLL